MNQLVENEKLPAGNQVVPTTSPPASPVVDNSLQPVSEDKPLPEANPKLPNTDPAQPPATPSQSKPVQDETEETPSVQETQIETPENTTTTQDQQTSPKDTETTKKKNLLSKIPKPIMIVATTIIVVTAISGTIWFTLNRNTEIDTSLLQEYLPEETQLLVEQEKLEKKIEDLPAQSQPEPKNSPETMGASDEKYAESQAEISFSETQWETIKDPIMGVQIEYPKNAVNIIKTDSSITLIRKTGYIFKIQITETALNITEYWKLIKASSLNYKVKETTFREKEALFLELEDFSDYPGDKYLVKHNNYIFDIWYATYSNTLSDDDARRIDVVLSSLKFI
jgi:hypothetical protein